MDFLVELEDIVGLRQEHLIVFCLSGTRRVLGRHTVFIGDVSSVMCHPREVFAHALDDRASHILIAHNHPSGDPSPSAHDIAVTQQLAAAGQIMGIRLSDHLIVTTDGHFSFRERGML